MRILFASTVGDGHASYRQAAQRMAGEIRAMPLADEVLSALL